MKHEVSEYGVRKFDSFNIPAASVSASRYVVRHTEAVMLLFG